MTRNERIEYHINAIAQEVFGYISENSDGHENGWISAVRNEDEITWYFKRRSILPDCVTKA